MANYYWVIIESDKMTQQVASEIFNRITKEGLVRHFEFYHGFIKYNSRGLSDIEDILNKYNISDDEINIKDEFELYVEVTNEREV